jgi:hypothetical protein
MKKPTWNMKALALCALLAAGQPAAADEGHNHDHGPAAPQGAASPRFEAASELFELVGTVDKPGQLTIHLDRFATNEPVVGAKIEFESGGEKGVAAAQPDGTYLVKLAALEKPGQIPFSFTVSAGSDTDLLAGELALADAHAHEEARAKPWARWAGLAVGGLVLAALAAAAARRIAQRGRRAAS